MEGTVQQAKAPSGSWAPSNYIGCSHPVQQCVLTAAQGLSSFQQKNQRWWRCSTCGCMAATGHLDRCCACTHLQWPFAVARAAVY